ncbi:hypothetical protein CRG98_042882 [Punica granatum]|uniref:Aminotransferase class I/classII large domain-containing protein n=1 Tax=Punica granatum TaxID=22663 RepID=A0A2I0HYE4_PUNGR|nr:hypothetical protein CRG98_042882 [Punica granatum]
MLKPPNSAVPNLSHRAIICNAINLAEGFPDFPAPHHIKAAGISAINSDFNQYRHVQGICDRLAEILRDTHGLEVDPLTDIAICCVIDPGDEVILFEPAFETYGGCISLAGGVPVYVALDPPYWTLDAKKLLNSFTNRTKALVLNSPHNPTGKVFTRDELEVIAGACRMNDCLAVTDEVYEYVTYDGIKHVSLASLAGMQERTIITSSLSKTFSVTGWRIGWAIAPALIASTIKNIHIRLTDSAPAPFQEAALTALTCQPPYFESLRQDYESKRDFLVKLLVGVGFRIRSKPQGSFFLFAELPENCLLSDVECVKKLIEEAGVVAVPGCGFFPSISCPSEDSHTVAGNQFNYQNRFIRFAFCKSDATLSSAALKLGEFMKAVGPLG